MYELSQYAPLTLCSTSPPQQHPFHRHTSPYTCFIPQLMLVSYKSIPHSFPKIFKIILYVSESRLFRLTFFNCYVNYTTWKIKYYLPWKLIGGQKISQKNNVGDFETEPCKSFQGHINQLVKLGNFYLFTYPPTSELGKSSKRALTVDILTHGHFQIGKIIQIGELWRLVITKQKDPWIL